MRSEDRRLLEERYPGVNLHDHRQDVHKQRRHSPNRKRYDVTERLLPEDLAGLRLLDVAGGAGEMSRRMTARGALVTFVDLNHQNVERASSDGLRALQVDLNRGLPGLDDEEFDGVVVLEAIEHLVKVEFLLSELNRVLRPGGFLVVSTPNFAHIANRLRILCGKLSVDEGYHYRFFTRKSLVAQLDSGGFTVERTSHLAPATGYNLFVSRVLGWPRQQIRVPDGMASLLARTLLVRARKKEKTRSVP